MRTGPRWWTLALAGVVWFLVLLEDTAVAIALPSLGRDLGLDLVALEWVVNLYTLSFAVLTLLGGLCVDRYGSWTVFQAGVAVFAVSSMLAGVSGGAGLLLAARAAQGAAAALAGPAVLALLLSSFAGALRGLALGVWSAVSAAALASGPLVGALLSTAYGWRSIFLVNVPLGLAVLLVSRIVMRGVDRPSPADWSGPVDWPGIATSTLGLSALVFGLTRSGTDGWASGSLWAVLGVAAASLAVFVLVERRARAPLLDLSLFRLPNLLAANVLGLVNLAIMCGLFFFLSLYLQTAAGSTPVRAGLALLPLTVLAAVTAPASGWLVGRVGPRWLITAGMALTMLGLLLLTDVDTRWGPGQLLPGLVVTGLGIGLATTPITTAAMDSVPDRRFGMASATLNTFRMVGLSIGVAVMGAVVSAQWPGDLATGDVDPEAFTAGLSVGFTVNAVLALAAAGLAVVAVKPVSRSREPTAAAP